MAKDTSKKLTEGNPMRLILGFMIPVLIGMLFQQLYSLVDTVIVGKALGSVPSLPLAPQVPSLSLPLVSAMVLPADLPSRLLSDSVPKTTRVLDVMSRILPGLPLFSPL